MSTSLTLTVNTMLEPPRGLPSVPESRSLSAMPTIHAINVAAALMEHTPFAIDDAKDDDGDNEDELGISNNNDQVMDEVFFFFWD